MDIETLKDFVSRQRAIRKVDPTRDVDDSLIEQIIEIGMHAPSGGNRQPFRFVVVRDAAVRARLAEIYDGIANARYGNPESRTTWSQVPVLIAVCSEGGSAPPGAGSAGASASRAASILPAVQNMLLAITALGLGSVLTTLWKEREAEVNGALGLPPGAEVHAILPVGWPDRRYGRNRRRPVSEVTFRDRWGAAW